MMEDKEPYIKLTSKKQMIMIPALADVELIRDVEIYVNPDIIDELKAEWVKEMARTDRPIEDIIDMEVIEKIKFEFASMVRIIKTSKYRKFIPPIIKEEFGDGKILMCLRPVFIGSNPYFYLIKVDSGLQELSHFYRCEYINKIIIPTVKEWKLFKAYSYGLFDIIGNDLIDR